MNKTIIRVEKTPNQNQIGFLGIQNTVSNIITPVAAIGIIYGLSEFQKGNKITGGGVAGVSAFMLFNAQQNKAKAEKKKDNNSFDDAKVNQSKVDKFKVQNIISRLENLDVHKGWLISYTTNESKAHTLLSDFLKLSDDNFKSVANSWKKKHQTLLRKDLSGWTVKQYAASIFETSKAKELKSKIFKRMNSLKIP